MEIVWNPRRVLGVNPNGSFTCVGKAKTGKRCRNSLFSNSDMEMASDLLDEMAASDPRDVKRHLRPLAKVTLCPRWHRKPGYSQVEPMIRQWWSVIVDYVEFQPIPSPISTPTPRPRNRNRAQASRSSETDPSIRRTAAMFSSPTLPITALSPLEENVRLGLTSTGFTSASLSLATPPPSPPSPELAPRSVPENSERAVESHQANLATLNLLTPPSSPPSPTPAPRLPRISNTRVPRSTTSTVSPFASLSLSTPPTSPPSPTPASRRRVENTEQAVESNESNLASLSLLTPPTSLPSSISAPMLLTENAEQVVDFSLPNLNSYIFFAPRETPPSPTPAPRFLRGSMRQSNVSDERGSENSNVPEPPSLSAPAAESLPEDTRTLDSIEPLMESPTLVEASITSIVPMERPLPSLPADFERPSSPLADIIAVLPLRAPIESPPLSRASCDRSASPIAHPTVMVAPIVTSPPSPKEARYVEENNSISTPLLKVIPTVTAVSLQNPPTTPMAPQRLPFSSTWQQIILESPVHQPSPSPYSYSKQLIPLSYQEETKSVDGGDSASCFTTCSGKSILSDCSMLWRKVSLGSRKAINAYICCSP